MNSKMSITQGTVAATGTLTAKSAGEPDFQANSGLLIEKLPTHWEINATHISGDSVRYMTFVIPLNLGGNGVPMSYSLVSGSDKNLAHAHYFSQDRLVVSTEGLLSIQYFESEQRMVGTFNFKGNIGGQEYILSEGKFDLKDITRTSAADKLQQHEFFAKLEGGIYHEFKSDEVEISFQENTQTFAVVANQRVWELDPPKPHRVTLFIAAGLKKGKYTFETGDPNIRAAYLDLLGSAYLAVEGTLELKEDPSVERIEATLEFTGKTLSLPERVAKLSNGVLSQTPASKKRTKA